MSLVEKRAMELASIYRLVGDSMLGEVKEWWIWGKVIRMRCFLCIQQVCRGREVNEGTREIGHNTLMFLFSIKKLTPICTMLHIY